MGKMEKIMRFLTKNDFVRTVNKPDIMSDIFTFKIPKGMVYAFSTRMNLSIYLQELTTATGDAANTTFALTSNYCKCADLGGVLLPLESLKDQVVVFVGGAEVVAGDMVIATSVCEMDAAPAALANNVQILAVSTFDTDPGHARAAGAYNGTLEIRAEAPAGQNIGIPIFSGDIQQIHEQTQADMLTPLKLDGAVLLPEGFVLAVKLLAPGVTVDGTDTFTTSGLVMSDDVHCVESLRIPFERFALRDFPKDFKARVLVSMSQS